MAKVRFIRALLQSLVVAGLPMFMVMKGRPEE